MNLRQAKIYVTTRLLGWEWVKTLDGKHFLVSPNKRTRIKLIYIEDL